MGFLLYGVLFIISLPIRLVPVLLISSAALTLGLTVINDRKILLTQSPITFLDFKITALNPQGLINAVKAPPWTIYLLYALAILAVVIVFWVLFHSSRVLSDARRKGTLGRLALNFIALILLVVTGIFFLKQFSHTVQEFVIESDVAWESKDFSDLSKKLSIWGFLYYSYYLEKNESGDYFNSRHSATPPSKKEIEEAVKEFVNLERARPHKKPNIVVVLAESTFNPSDAFRLTKPIKNRLFEPNKYTQAIGPMYVNAVGGGTWITEFESIIGVDSRLFGYSGYYTHASLSPYVSRSFATYLKDHGYSTETYQALEGDFYNAANAYRNYGFDRFYENIGGAGWDTTDEQFIDAVISMSHEEDKPFFKYLVTIQNHSPHRCKNFKDKTQFVTMLKGLDEFNELNCALNEYVLNAKSTSRAFIKLIKYLEEQEKLTGRPFVLLIFGDHQPHTFSKSASVIDYYNSEQYQKFRKNFSERETFFHIVSSIPGVLKCCGGTAPHVTMMPTLLSAYVASDLDDMYLDVNLYSLKNCGPDFLNNEVSHGGYLFNAPETPQTGKCPVYENLLNAYRNAEIFKDF
ncbi:MAG: sulfatase-like hydrolase/transferase [Deltaproteobacteria bacterium]